LLSVSSIVTKSVHIKDTRPVLIRYFNWNIVAQLVAKIKNFGLLRSAIKYFFNYYPNELNPYSPEILTLERQSAGSEARRTFLKDGANIKSSCDLLDIFTSSKLLRENLIPIDNSMSLENKLVEALI